VIEGFNCANSGLVPSHLIDKLLVAAQKGKLERQIRAVKRLGKNGYGAYQVVKQISEVVLSNEALQPSHKARIFEKLAVDELSFWYNSSYRIFTFRTARRDYWMVPTNSFSCSIS